MTTLGAVRQPAAAQFPPPDELVHREEMGGGVLFVAGFIYDVAQIVAEKSPHRVNWPCATASFTDGENSISAVFQDCRSGCAEVMVVPFGLAVTRPILRRAYQCCLELHAQGVRQLRLWVETPDTRLQRRLARLGFREVEGVPLFLLDISQFLSAAGRRRFRQSLI